MKCLTKDCKTRSLLMTVELCYPCSQLIEKGKREWVSLTDEEVGTLTVFDGLHDVETPLLANFIRAIEAKLKEKNNE